jgi:hypothetical protein
MPYVKLTLAFAFMTVIGIRAATDAQQQTPPPSQAAPAVPRWQPPDPTNLQVLPKDITKPQLVQTMRSFALGLGVRCEHCHVGEGSDLSKFDFASDAKPQKGIARRMFQMTRDINDRHLEGFPRGRTASTPAVTCYSCHRGQTKPLIANPF